MLAGNKVKHELVAGEGIAGALPYGVSLPIADIHAVGVSMPTYQDVVAYEEGTAEPLSGGYPRFVFLAPVKRLFETAASLFAAPGETAMAMPSARAALRLQQFLARAGVEQVGVHDFYANGVFAVTFPTEDASTAKLYWQHAGEIVSSRLAEEVHHVVSDTCYENEYGGVAGDSDSGGSSPRGGLASDDGRDVAARHLARGAESAGDGGDEVTVTAPRKVVPELYQKQRPAWMASKAMATNGLSNANAVDRLRKRVGSLYGEDESNAFVYPSGMGAVSAAHRLLKLASHWDETPLRTIVVGFP
jgi:cystathionine gamma-synthase